MLLKYLTDMKDWNCIYRECKKLSAHWYDIGACLGLHPDDLERIMQEGQS
jgi:hypothetical protein